jgi:hypothetical protein
MGKQTRPGALEHIFLVYAVLYETDGFLFCIACAVLRELSSMTLAFVTCCNNRGFMLYSMKHADIAGNMVWRRSWSPLQWFGSRPHSCVASCCCSVLIWPAFLIGGSEHDFYDFPYIGHAIIPTDELIFFRGVETTNQF